MDASPSIASMDIETLVQEHAALKIKIEQLERTLNEVRASVGHAPNENDVVSDSDKIKLDVSGQIFVTTLGTLRKLPETMLAAMFSGNWTLPIEKDGPVFLDRDPFVFGILLQYLREYPDSALALRELPM